MNDVTTFFDNLLTVGILASLIVLFYCKIMKKTIGEVITDIKEALEENE